MIVNYEAIVQNDIENVFNFVADFNRRTEWIDLVGECSIIHKTNDWIGSRYTERLDFKIKSLLFEYEIIAFEYPTRLTSESETRPHRPKLNIELSDKKNGLVNCQLELEMKLGPLNWLPAPFLKKRIDYFFKPAIDNFIRLNNLLDQ